MRPYRVLITHEVLTLEKPAGRDRERIIRFLESLSADPFQPGDYEEKDETGRPIQIKVIGDVALTYWVDHGSQEVKVIRLEKSDRR